MIVLKRAYEPPSEDDGFRILVERLWPRGLTKEAAKLDAWLKEIAPSQDLRKWFAHDYDKWEEFKRRYNIELDQNPTGIQTLRSWLTQHPKVTFVYAAKDELHNSAMILKAFLEAGD